MLASFMSQSIVILDEKFSIGKTNTPHWPRVQFLVPILSATTLGLVVLNGIRKQVEQAENMPVSGAPPWPLHLLLTPGSCCDFHQS